ncbi:MAG TPA: symmetrical bis(5'-nucleosyl)-tetraphosphatase [Steroidobacteraceae bacterium]|nr:symmetrical bis(5'-nucleosyl)-tetraphosphatase [Steroidobacteraceae bacterium]
MARYAIGDIQGCFDELKALLERCHYSADRDELWFVGDLVNRGPKSLETLRFVRSLGAGATVVLGNHDLHLLALAFGSKRKPKDGDTLDEVLEARDRDQLLEWLSGRPLAVFDEPRGDFLVHAGLVPEWSPRFAAQLAREVEAVLRDDARSLFDAMYGNKPEKWSDELRGMDRLRFAINVFTRMRYCRRDGTLDLKVKDAPGAQPAELLPWFDVPGRRSRDVRVICGHWSTLGLVRRRDLLALDTGCVWGGALTAVNLDAQVAPVQSACAAHQDPGGGEG